MALGTHVDVDAVLRAVAPRLDGAEWKGHGDRRWVQGRVRGREVTVVCWHEQTRQGGSGWKVTSNVDGLPLLLAIDRKAAGGSASAVATNDPRFDEAWVVKAAPARTAERILDDAVREAIVRLGSELRPPVVLPVLRSALAAPIEVDGSSVVVSCQGKFDASAVLAGLEVAVLLVERVAPAASWLPGH